MGVHIKQDTIQLISFLKSLGIALGYHTETEELMFPGNPNSPELDLTWRRGSSEPVPLFIFEVESAPTKSAVDNVMKVFARDTDRYVKPLFFFHVFAEQPIGAERIGYLKENYDKQNYGAYLVDEPEDQIRLLGDILAQHFRVARTLDLVSLIRLIEAPNPLSFKTIQLLNMLVELGYDALPESNFLEKLESLILSEQYNSVREFYQGYLPRVLCYSVFPPQTYDPPFLTPVFLSEVVHHALASLLSDQPKYEFHFAKLCQIEQRVKYLPLWQPSFGLSSDGDNMLLSEFPLILTVLCAGFASTEHSKYFSIKLRNILSASGPLRMLNHHGFVWLLIASQIANDPDSYEFARLVINGSGGTFLQALVRPLVYVSIDSDYDVPVDYCTDKILVPLFREWPEWISEFVKTESMDLLSCIIRSFLIMEDWEASRALFANYCLRLSIAGTSDVIR